jgi:hypothetical protein
MGLSAYLLSIALPIDYVKSGILKDYPMLAKVMHELLYM